MNDRVCGEKSKSVPHETWIKVWYAEDPQRKERAGCCIMERADLLAGVRLLMVNSNSNSHWVNLYRVTVRVPPNLTQSSHSAKAGGRNYSEVTL